MAGQDPFLARLQRLLAAMDDDALASLASKGLVRRAQKDLQTITPEILAVEADHVRLRVGEYEVTVPDVPARATSTSPATGICRHILAALIFLRDSAQPEPTDPEAAMEAARQELASLDDEALERWAGKARFRRALRAVAEGLAPEIEEREAIVIRLPARNIVCRWLPRGGLETMVCSGPSADARVDGLVAVLAYQVAVGARQVEYEQAALEASTEAPRTRDEVLASVGAILREMVGLGLSRLSEATENRLRTLAVSAHGVDLPRLERMLRAVADEVALMLRRDAQAAATNLLAGAARIEALRCALGRPNAVLVGRHRSRYESVGNIELVGMGARLWQTRSGYRGLTVYFWDRSLKSWATWSDARPVSVAAFDPASRYCQDGPWGGCPSPSKASRSLVRLTGAWRNPMGRLSGRPSTKAIVASGSTAADFPQAVCRWPELWRRAVGLFGGGFQDRSEQDEIVFLQPHDWLPAEYDHVAQRLVRPVLDPEGRPLHLILAYDEQLTAEAIESLQSYDPARNRGVLGLLRLGQGELFVEPISLGEEDRILSLSLDEAGATSVRSRSRTPSKAPGQEEPGEPGEDVTGDEPDELVPSGSATAVGLLLTTALTELEAVAEGGVAAARDTETLVRLADRSQGLGLACCAVAVNRLLDQLRRARKSPDESARGPAAEALLHAYYVTLLASQQESIAAAVPALPG